MRNSSIELLRNLAMLLIVAHHLFVHYDWVNSYHEYNLLYLQVLAFGGKLGANIFVIISGYYLYSTQFKLKGVFDLLFKTWFYSLLILILVSIFNADNVTKTDVVKSIFPFGYWFINAYICMYVVSPILNKIINKFSQQDILIFLFIFSMVTIIPVLNFSVGEFGFFVYLYVVGAFIRKYKLSLGVTKCFTVILINVLLIFLSIYILSSLAKVNNIFNYPMYFTGMKSPFIIILSIFSFLFFNQFRIKHSRFINYISTSVIAIYLIHDNSLLRPLIWNFFIDNGYLYSNDHIYIYPLLIILTVFVSCILIDIVLRCACRIFYLSRLKDIVVSWLVSILNISIYKFTQRTGVPW
ncbi:acyltransferase family protein [Vibrio breoganii]